MSDQLSLFCGTIWSSHFGQESQPQYHQSSKYRQHNQQLADWLFMTNHQSARDVYLMMAAVKVWHYTHCYLKHSLEFKYITVMDLDEVVGFNMDRYPQGINQIVEQLEKHYNKGMYSKLNWIIQKTNWLKIGSQWVQFRKKLQSFRIRTSLACSGQ